MTVAVYMIVQGQMPDLNVEAFFVVVAGQPN